MLMFKRALRDRGVTASVEAPAAAPQPDLHAVIRSIGQQASNIGRESAEVRGLLDDTSQASQRGVLAVAAL